ncbi:MAG TPA: hypothetical protein PKK11_03990 [Methanothrix sp.]|nr:hypothetical protein [Methanothrix sp.]HPT19193.1 hypothetical protein [Methanothrix sp.]
MMPAFETTALEVLQRTPTTRSIRFSRPAGFDYLPGQFVILTLKGRQEDGTQEDGGGVGDAMIKKPLSLSSSPSEDFLEVTKRLTGHEFSNALLSVKEADGIQVSGPYGSFSFRGEHKKVAMLSGGIGITPLRSMIKYCTDKSLDTDILLIYSNRSEGDIPFGDEFELLEERNLRLKVVNTLTRPGPDWKGRTGRIDAAMIQEFAPDYGTRVFYSSGPAAMVDAMISALEQLGIAKEQIKKEYFPGYD